MIIKVKQWKFELCEGEPMIITEPPRNGFWEDSDNWRVTPNKIQDSPLQPYAGVWNQGDGLRFSDCSVTVPKPIREEFLRKIMELQGGND
jgi:hypothetical protein